MLRVEGLHCAALFSPDRQRSPPSKYEVAIAVMYEWSPSNVFHKDWIISSNNPAAAFDVNLRTERAAFGEQRQSSKHSQHCDSEDQINNLSLIAVV